MNEGVMAESFNLAKIWMLPIIFVIEDNGFGEATANSFASAGEFLRRAAGYSFQAPRWMGPIFLQFMKPQEKPYHVFARAVDR